MDKIERDFHQRDQEDQASFLQQTWCNQCQKADLGMVEPEEYELDGIVTIEGKCKVCGDTVITELAPDDGEHDNWED